MTKVITVQGALKSVKNKQLAKIYLDEYESKGMSKKQYEHAVKMLRKYFKSLQEVKVADTDLVAFVCHKLSNDSLGPQPEFVVQKLSNLGDVRSNLGLEFTKINKILGINVVMTWKTRHYLYELLAYLINEMTFFGWDQEGLEDEQEKLDKSVKEVQDHPENLVSFDSVADMSESLGIDITKFDHFDREEYNLMLEIMKKQSQLYDHSYKREVGKVKRILIRNGLLESEVK